MQFREREQPGEFETSRRLLYTIGTVILANADVLIGKRSPRSRHPPRPIGGERGAEGYRRGGRSDDDKREVVFSFAFGNGQAAIAGVNSRPRALCQRLVWFHCRDRGSKFKLDLTSDSGPARVDRSMAKCRRRRFRVFLRIRTCSNRRIPVIEG